jgi:hypothetical protein
VHWGEGGNGAIVLAIATPQAQLMIAMSAAEAKELGATAIYMAQKRLFEAGAVPGTRKASPILGLNGAPLVST